MPSGISRHHSLHSHAHRHLAPPLTTPAMREHVQRQLTPPLTIAAINEHAHRHLASPLTALAMREPPTLAISVPIGTPYPPPPTCLSSACPSAPHDITACHQRAHRHAIPPTNNLLAISVPIGTPCHPTNSLLAISVFDTSCHSGGSCPSCLTRPILIGRC